MKAISFNVNSIRTRIHQLEAVIQTHSPDFIGLQETKVSDVDFPLEQIHGLGYQVEFFGQKTHYGVAILAKHPFVSVTKGFRNDAEDDQKRFIGGSFHVNGKNIHLLNGYFPQGESQDHPVKFPNKRRFYRDLLDHLESTCKKDDLIMLMGDMNVSHKDLDIGIGEDNRKRWLRTGKCSFLPEEREWLEALMNWGLIDTYRAKYPVADTYSWFDYRSGGFEQNPKRGLRIDLILASEKLAQSCVDAGIDYDIRAMEKPSDHCPIWAEFNLLPERK
jgi:exodeoxyribonuclease III